MPNDRMYRVIVLSGIGLVACGGTVVANADGGQDGFPVEGKVAVDGGSEAGTDGFPAEGLTADVMQGDEFPSETAMVIDSGPPDGFAMEGPIAIDGGKP
jgi:hypothetical protein